MTNRKTTRRALVLSLLSLLLCCSMLVGTTFAWFTDSVTSGNNKIIAGNLDIELYYQREGQTEWTKVDSNTNVFKEDTLWEPGHTEVVKLKVVNEGTLALKYQLGVNIAGETGSKNVLGSEFKLSDYIQYGIVEGAQSYTREQAIEAVEATATALNVAYGSGTVKLYPKTDANADNEDIVTMVVYMPTSVDNSANHAKGEAVPTILLGVDLFATQVEAENDSFGNDYDKGIQFVEADEIKAGFKTPDGTDLTKKINKVIFGKPSEYPEVVANYTPISGNAATTFALTADAAVSEQESMAVYQVPVVNNMYDVYYLSEGPIVAPADSSKLFADLVNVTQIDVSNLDMSSVENALCMFLNCSKLETLDTADWDTSNITNMQSMFYGCYKLKNIDISNWDTSNVTNMRMVFFRCYELPNEVLKGVENWDVSNVTNFYSMFKHARGMTSLDLSKWDTSNATNMSHLFANIGGLQSLDLSSWNTSKVTDMSWMFYDASKLTTIYIGEGWTTASVDPSTPTAFYNNQALVGGNGTTWLNVCDMANPNRPWESSAKLVYAVADSATAQGLLTLK